MLGFSSSFQFLEHIPEEDKDLRAIIFLLINCIVFFLSPSIINLWLVLLLSRLFISIKLIGECKIRAVKYFIFQELATWMALIFLILGVSSFRLLALIFKMGLPPFHNWIISIIKKLDHSIKWVIVSRKIIPMITCLCLPNNILIPMIIIIFSLFRFLAVLSMKEILIMRSGYNLSWAFLTSIEIFHFRLLFTLTYLTYLELFLEFRKTDRPHNFLEYLVVLGLPPRGFFFIKLIIVRFYRQHLAVLLILIMRTIFLLLNYLKLTEYISYLGHLSSPKILSDKGLWFSLHIVPLLLLIL